MAFLAVSSLNSTFVLPGCLRKQCYGSNISGNRGLRRGTSPFSRLPRTHVFSTHPPRRQKCLLCIPRASKPGCHGIHTSRGEWSDSPDGVVFSCEELCNVTGGTCLRAGPAGSICTDSRGIHPGQWFLALKGGNFDGNNFLTIAQEAGCAGVIVDSHHTIPDLSVGTVVVPDCLKALGMLASNVRARFHGPVVGVTGSCGKTTARSMIGLALSGLGHIVHETEGNLNSQIGLPLTILKSPSAASCWVLEMGMSIPGEIEALSKIALPTVRVITNIAPVHLEGCGSLQGVASAKAELIATSREGDVCVLNHDDPYIRKMHASECPKGVKAIWFGSSPEADVQLLSSSSSEGMANTDICLRVAGWKDGDLKVSMATPGLHLGINAAAAVAVAVALGLSPEEWPKTAEALGRYQPVGMRMRAERHGGVTVLNDSYNANPLSMSTALQFLSGWQGRGRKVALLGDMKELGSMEAAAHLDVLKECFDLGVDLLAVCGPAFQLAVQRLELAEGSVFVGGDVRELIVKALPLLRPGDTVLVKGSRGMGMELCVAAINELWLV